MDYTCNVTEGDREVLVQICWVRLMVESSGRVFCILCATVTGEYFMNFTCGRCMISREVVCRWLHDFLEWGFAEKEENCHNRLLCMYSRAPLPFACVNGICGGILLRRLLIIRPLWASYSMWSWSMVADSGVVFVLCFLLKL
jgi:hypothetical protein